MITQNQLPETVSKNAIPVGKEFVNHLKSALRKKANPIDKLPSDREILDLVVQQMHQAIGNKVYYKGPQGSDTYLWFDSDVAKLIQGDPEVKDKRRYVEALIGAYLGGRDWLLKYAVSSRVIRPRIMNNEEVTGIRETAAAIADAKSVESAFVPGSDRSGGPANSD